MQTVSQDWLDLAAGQHRVEVRVKIDREDYPEGYWILQDNNLNPILTSSSANIEVAPFPAADLQEGQLFGVTITGGLFATQSFTIGSCVSREIEVRFLLGEAVIPRMAKIQPEVRLVNDNGDASEWIPKGTFWLDTRELDRTTGIMTIRGYDAMLKGESLYIVPGEDVGEWPKTMADVADEIADMMGLTIDARTTLDQTYEMQLPTDYTMRELLGYIAVANCGNWVVTDEGKLRLIRVNDTVDSVDLGLAAKTYHISEPYQAFSKVELDLSEELYVEAGDDTGRTLEVALPVVSTEDGETIAAAILDALYGFVYTPLTADGAILDPAYEIGDAVTVGDATVGTTTGILATQTMKLDSLCASDVTSPGDEELDHEYPYQSTSKRNIERKINKINATLYVGPDSIIGRVEDLEDNYSEISQSLSSISLSVTTTSGVASIVLSVDGSSVGSGSIDMTGYVTFTNLSTSGQTTIDGGNITTGTISADRISTSGLKVDTVYAYTDDDYRILSSRIQTLTQSRTREIVNLGNESPSRYNESVIVNHATTFVITDSSSDDLGTLNDGLFIDMQDARICVADTSSAMRGWYLGGPRESGDSNYGWFDRIYMGSSAYIYINSSDEFTYRDSNGNDTVLGSSSGSVFSQIEFTNGEYITINYRGELIYNDGSNHVFLFAGSDFGDIDTTGDVNIDGKLDVGGVVTTSSGVDIGGYLSISSSLYFSDGSWLDVVNGRLVYYDGTNHYLT